MSKRLEELKKKTTGKDYLWAIKYAKEQAERVQELEEDYEYLSHHYGLETEQNKRYREAIDKVVGDDNLSPYQKRILKRALEGDPHDT